MSEQKKTAFETELERLGEEIGSCFTTLIEKARKSGLSLAVQMCEEAEQGIQKIREELSEALKKEPEPDETA